MKMLHCITKILTGHFSLLKFYFILLYENDLSGSTRALIGHSTFIPLKLCIFFPFIMPSDNTFIQVLTIINTYGITVI